VKKKYIILLLFFCCSTKIFAQKKLPDELQICLDTAQKFDSKFYAFIDAGDYYYQQYNATGFSDAAFYFDKARALAVASKDSIYIGIAYHSLAQVYDAIGDDKLPKALEYYQLYNRTSFLTKDTGIILRSYINIALTEMRLKKEENCTITIEKLIALALRYNKFKLTNRCYVVGAYVLTSLNKFELGKNYLNKIDIKNDTIINASLSYGNMYHLANVLLLNSEKKYAEGLLAGEKALQNCSNASDSLSIISNLANMAFNNGQYKIAYSYKEKENELYGKITRGKSLNDVNNSLLQSELKLKEENSQLLLQSQKTQKKITNGLIFGLLLMTIAISGILWLAINRRRKNIELANQVNENKLLLQEVHHRVKNNLQIINSFLLIEENKENGGGKTFIKELQSKIQAISLLHQKLFKEDDFKSVLLQPYFEQLFEKIISSHVSNEEIIKWNIQTNNLFLKQDKLISLALITTELLLNSIKHVAVNQNCTITFNLVQKDNFIFYEYIDNGKGMQIDFNINKITTTGLMLVKQLSKQLGASISLIRQNESNGFAIKIPIG
jgi:two-component sensor histidine kinase